MRLFDVNKTSFWRILTSAIFLLLALYGVRIGLKTFSSKQLVVNPNIHEICTLTSNREYLGIDDSDFQRIIHEICQPLPDSQFTKFIFVITDAFATKFAKETIEHYKVKSIGCFRNQVICVRNTV